jgi:hypothetical protein
VDYTYNLFFDPEQYKLGESFTVCAELYGDDLGLDQPLGEEFYDAHLIQLDSHMPVERHFIVSCEDLDETLGTDKIYLQLVVKSSAGEVFTAKSATIRDRF